MKNSFVKVVGTGLSALVLAGCATVNRTAGDVNSEMAERGLERKGINLTYMTRNVPLKRDEIVRLEIGLNTLGCQTEDFDDGVIDEKTHKALGDFADANAGIFVPAGITPETIQPGLEALRAVNEAVRTQRNIAEEGLAYKTGKRTFRAVQNLMNFARADELKPCYNTSTIEYRSAVRQPDDQKSPQLQP